MDKTMLAIALDFADRAGLFGIGRVEFIGDLYEALEAAFADGFIDGADAAADEARDAFEAGVEDAFAFDPGPAFLKDAPRDGVIYVNAQGVCSHDLDELTDALIDSFRR